MKTILVKLVLILGIFLLPSQLKANYYTSDLNPSNYIEANYEAEITILIVGTVIIIKNILTSKVVVLGVAFAKQVLQIGGAGYTIYNLYSLLHNRAELARVNSLLEMTDNELYDYCHKLNGGMASTVDARQNQWGDSYIFGVIRPYEHYYYAGAVCISSSL
jgi:alpha-galactosidase